jgi:hypothetical protein
MSLDDYEIDILEQYESGKLESLSPLLQILYRNMLK